MFEWLPWHGGAEKPLTEAEYKLRFRQRHSDLNRRYGKDDTATREYIHIRITRWGNCVPREDVVRALYPDS